ncbi:MAG: Crp/Fnr family transcriptional regulator [Flavobacteriaceae bacterium]|nr:Crp/Fnr family transcriptional regulator [Flavobacteriaceae bacterium]
MLIEHHLEIEHNFQNIFCEKSFEKTLSEEEFQKYLNSKKAISVAKGKLVFKEGDMPKGVYFIEKGAVKLYKMGFNRKEQILRFAKDGDLIGYRSLLSEEEYGASAEAMTPVQLSFIPANIFHKLLMNVPKLSYAMLQKISCELGEYSNTIALLAQKTVRERLAEVLLLLEKKIGIDPEGFIKLCLTREEIANLIGTATESTIRLISEFKQDKLIEVEGRNIKILDHDRLRKLGHVIGFN